MFIIIFERNILFINKGLSIWWRIPFSTPTSTRSRNNISDWWKGRRNNLNRVLGVLQIVSSLRHMDRKCQIPISRIQNNFYTQNRVMSTSLQIMDGDHIVLKLRKKDANFLVSMTSDTSLNILSIFMLQKKANLKEFKRFQDRILHVLQKWAKVQEVQNKIISILQSMRLTNQMLQDQRVSHRIKVWENKAYCKTW